MTGKEKVFLTVEEITPASFAQFGSIIDRKLVFGDSDSNILFKSKQSNQLPPKATWANQGSAIKLGDASHLTNFYSEIKSSSASQPAEAGKARPVMTLFVCSPRKLLRNPDETIKQQTGATVHVSYKHALKAARAGRNESDIVRYYLDLNVLERHPYTSQTFIPMGLQARNGSTVYLVVVAPTLSESVTTLEHRPEKGHRAERERDMSSAGPPAPSSPHYQRKDPGRPDLERIRAYLVDGDTAVTYAAGTWHAPMIVLGADSVDFVVVQFANGVADDDCQEVDITKDKIAVQIAVPGSSSATSRVKSAASVLQIGSKAKL